MSSRSLATGAFRSCHSLLFDTSPFIHPVSLERIFGYTQIEQEPKSTKEGTPPAYWPASGKLEVSNLSAKYSADGPKVLKDVNFKLESGERIGVGTYFDEFYGMLRG